MVFVIFNKKKDKKVILDTYVTKLKPPKEETRPSKKIKKENK